MNALSRILENKKEEVERKKKVIQKPSFSQQGPGKGAFFSAFKNTGRVKLIAEIKRKSPSAGIICKNFDPLSIADEYVKGGASAISVLTDEKFFGGSPEILRAVKSRFPSIPILYKDFVIDRCQIYEAYNAGADAILLIVAILTDEKLKEFIQLCNSCGLDPLVEIHTEEELERALKCGAYIIGVNNRDLRTFAVDINVSLKLSDLIPEGVVKISESGIRNPRQVRLLEMKGYNGVLIGQAFMESENRCEFLKEMQSGENQPWSG